MKVRLFWLTIFAVAMAFCESAVVIYLRLNYYPNGFSFPIVLVDGLPAVVEVCREAATLFILVSVGVLAGKRFQDRFAYFIYSFGIWDVFYYIWLWVVLRWPESFFTWDLLFLIPVPWVGPVAAPIIVSLSLLIVAVVTLNLGKRGYPIHFGRLKWLLEIAAALIVFLSFVWDYRVVLDELPPTSFKWLIFAAGMILGWAVFLSELVRIKKLR